MIAFAGAPVVIDLKELRRCRQHEVSLFPELAGEAVYRCFIAIEAAAGKMPARQIGMPYEKHAPRIVETGGPHAERHAARQGEIQMRKPRQKANPP